MTYSYNRLQKMLIDTHMTKTEMRKMARISTNILAKIATALQCRMDDIVEVSKDRNET